MFQSPGRATVSELKARAERIAPSPIASAKRLANNTMRADLEDGGKVYLLHNTAILTVRADGAFTVDTGGFNSHTTRERLNRYLPDGWRVYTEGGVIHIWRHADGQRGTATPFLRICHVNAKGEVKPDITPAALLDDSKLISRFMKHVAATGLPKAEDSGGDPWVFGQLDEVAARDWLESLYWTRRCFTLALQRAGMRDEGIAYTLYRIDREGGKLDKMELGRVRRLMRNAIGRG